MITPGTLLPIGNPPAGCAMPTGGGGTRRWRCRQLRGGSGGAGGAWGGPAVSFSLPRHSARGGTVPPRVAVPIGRSGRGTARRRARAWTGAGGSECRGHFLSKTQEEIQSRAPPDPTTAPVEGRDVGTPTRGVGAAAPTAACRGGAVECSTYSTAPAALWGCAERGPVGRGWNSQDAWHGRGDNARGGEGNHHGLWRGITHGSAAGAVPGAHAGHTPGAGGGAVAPAAP